VTRETSDWSRAPVHDVGTLRVTRTGKTAEAWYRLPDVGFVMMRQFVLAETVWAGLYAAAPVGPGFSAQARHVSFLIDPHVT
jgi:regulation of enolase protein 1 (concanavalin A-like superfamily)